MVGLIAASVVLVFYLAFLVLFVVGWWKIISKARYSGAWALIGFVPVVNVVMFFVFAFSDWPVHRQLRGPRPFGDASIPPRPY